MILQEERTLDDVIQSSVKTFRNGCNYRLVKEKDDLYYLTYGCYGVLINLISGDDRLLYNWFIDKSQEDPLMKVIRIAKNIPEQPLMARLSGNVNFETIDFLLKQKPCKVCGGARFYLKE